ncbi:MAG: hypothetical protein ACYTEZ_14440 [Planctomycetota bacterium]|jgi:hypothetical protein
MHARIVLLLALAAGGACQAQRVAVDRQRGLDGAWATPRGETRLDATGEVVTLRFQGRVFEFAGLTAFRGHIDAREVALRGDRLTIRLTRERLEIRHPGGRIEGPLSRIPEGGRVRYAAGRLRVR